MHCLMHPEAEAVGVCAACQRGVCPACVGQQAPRVVCRTCVERRPTLGFEYRSAAAIGSWPLVHVALGVDTLTGRPRVARGVIAIGNIAVGAVAVAGLSLGLVTLGGLSVGLVAAVGGLALGLGVSVGGLAVGSLAVGGLAVGLQAAMGGGAFAPAVIDGRHCDPAARALIVDWLGSRWLPPHC